MTTTIRRSQDLNLEQIINQTFKFEEALHSALEEVGERFGLYDIMARCGPITPDCLATQAGISQRAARAWLDALAAGDCVQRYTSADLYCLWSPWPPHYRG